MTTLWVRADGSASMGLGHIMRTVALGQAARCGGLTVKFVVARDPVGTTLPARFGFPVLEVPTGNDRGWVAQVCTADLVFLDGYHFSLELLEAVLEATGRVGSMTDVPERVLPTPVIVNQTMADHADYGTTTPARLLIGPKYALIREEFFPHRKRARDFPDRALVTMGGSDPARIGPELAARTSELVARIEVTLLCGPSAPQAAVPGVAVVSDPPDVPARFAAADLAISAAGSTTWELLYLGVPSALVQVADNQRTIGPGVADAGAALFLGAAVEARLRLPEALAELTRSSRRAELSSAAMELVDGRGPERVLEALLGLTSP